MAGIGFALKRLAGKDNLSGIARAYAHATMASSGPWLFAVIALAGISLLFTDYFGIETLINFRIVVVYNFGFSLILASLIHMVVTRYLADNIHRKDVTQTPTVMLRSLAALYVILLPLSLYYYGYYVIMDLSMRLLAISNLYLVSTIWVLGVFMVALKDYKAVTRAFGVGMFLAIVLSQLLKNDYGSAGLLTGFNIGLTWIAFTLVAKIYAEYPYKLSPATELRRYFIKYWELALGGFFYTGAIWVDKWLMWRYAPEAIELPSRMVYYPDYDSAMFLSYLTIIPALALFIFSVETNFFERYQRLYFDILDHKPLSTLRQNHRRIVTTILESSRNFFVIQGTITLLCILTAAQIFNLLNVNYMQISIFRLGTLGAFFHVLTLFEMIILSYFDCRRAAMLIQAIFLAANAIFTMITIDMGFVYYGYGYFLAALLVFAISSVVMFEHIRKLPYHAFITNNSSLKPVADEAA